MMKERTRKNAVMMIVCFGIILAITFSSDAVASTFDISGGLLYGFGSGSHRHSGLGIHGAAAVNVFQGFRLDFDGLIGTATKIGGEDPDSYESLTQQVFQVGVAYKVEEDQDFRAYVGGGLLVFRSQYRSGEANNQGNINSTTVGPYAGISVTAQPETGVRLGAEVAYSPWASGGSGNDDQKATLLKLKGTINYHFTNNLAVQGTIIRNNHSESWGLSSTWLGLGASFVF